MAHEIAGLIEPSLRHRDPGASTSDPDSKRTERLPEVLPAAFASYRHVPAMAKGLAETAAGSGREAYRRKKIGELLAQAESFHHIGEDDLSKQPFDIYGDRLTRSVYYALRTKDSQSVFKIRLNEAGQALDFDYDEL